MWRPDGWDETVLEIIGKMKQQGTVDLTRRALVEAGADAMHKADIEWLRKMNVSKDINDCLVIEGDAFLEFIEEEE